MDLNEAFKKLKEAEKYAHPKSSLFFKKSPEWAEAAHSYETAANMFRAQHSNGYAVEAYMKAAEAHMNSNSLYLAAKCSETAASILERDNKADEACRNYELASQQYVMANSADRAAAMLMNAAKSVEKTNVEKAVSYYKRACEAVDDGESRLAYDTYKKVIIALIKLRVINEAIDIAMRLNAIYIEKKHANTLFKNELTIIILLLFNDKFSVAEDYFNMFCGEKSDHNGTNYVDFGNKFLNSEEGICADDMLNAYANSDQELMNKCTSSFCVKYLDNEVVKITRELRSKVSSGQTQFSNNNNDIDICGNDFAGAPNNNLGSSNNNYGNNNSDPMMLTDIWKDKLQTLNSYINEGKFSFHTAKLKDGIHGILEAFPIIDRVMNDCMSSGDNNGRHNLSNVKADMEQTCWRFECMTKGKKVESFRSAFEGNNRRYFFNKNTLFEEKDYVPYNNTDTEKKELTGMQKFGHALKDSVMKVGTSIKNTTVRGYNYVREKITDEPSQQNNEVSDSCYSYSKNEKITNKKHSFTFIEK